MDRATRLELPVRQEAIPHIVGSKGRTIRALEDKFGVAIGVMDVPDMGALVSFMGPEVQVLWAKVCWRRSPKTPQLLLSTCSR